jgi:hypothetical protein
MRAVSFRFFGSWVGVNSTNAVLCSPEGDVGSPEGCRQHFAKGRF